MRRSLFSTLDYYPDTGRTLVDVHDADGLCRAMIARKTGFFGTEEQVAKQLEHYRGLGVEHVSILGELRRYGP